MFTAGQHTVIEQIGKRRGLGRILSPFGACDIGTTESNGSWSAVTFLPGTSGNVSAYRPGGRHPLGECWGSFKQLAVYPLSPAENHPAQNVNSAKVKKYYFIG